MEVLLLTNEYPPNIYGGAGVHVEYLSRELAKLIKVDVRSFGNQDHQSGNLSVMGYDYDPAPFSACDPGLKSPLSALNRCISFAAKPTNAQIVHCHTWYTLFGGILAKIGYGLPLVVTTHSLEPLRPWKREQIGTGYDISCWLEKTALEMADAIIAVSQGMKADILRLFAVPEEKIKIVYNGIDTQDYKPIYSKDSLVKYGVTPNIPYVLFVGRITRQKGIIHLVNAFHKMNRDVQMVFAAGQPDTPEIAEEMQTKVKEIQKHRKVVWIQEWIKIREKIELYSNAAVFCCPSVYEPFGIINLEAMACGTPVVASAVGGIAEIVQHGKTGLLVPLELDPSNPFEPVDAEAFARDLAENLDRVLASEELQKSMGEAGRKRAETVFSWKAIAQATLDVYRSLLR
ncbi:MAG: glycogen synthase [Proteobacteria bacterium]|nr:glycogen synthase [Pseudomonadota bacterium]